MKCLWPKNETVSGGGDEKVNRLRWAYHCASCDTQFSVDVPKGPAQERALTCPACGSPDIRKLTAYHMAESGCGG